MNVTKSISNKGANNFRTDTQKSRICYVWISGAKARMCSGCCSVGLYFGDEFDNNLKRKYDGFPGDIICLALNIWLFYS